MAQHLISQFEVCRNPERRSQARVPYILVLQSDRIEGTFGVVVAPLVQARYLDARDRLYPIFQVGDDTFAMITTEIAVVPRGLLVAPVASLANDRHRIIAALDLLFTGV